MPAATRPPPEGSLTFLPTSADSFPAKRLPSRSSFPRSFHSSAMAVPSQPDAWAIKSAIQSNGSAILSSSPSIASGLPSPASTHQASQPMPNQTPTSRTSTGHQSLAGQALSADLPALPHMTTAPILGAGNFWQDQYNKILKLHDEERKLWQAEREQLIFEKDQALCELFAVRHDSGISMSGQIGQASSADKENTRTWFDPEIVRASQEKLREISVVSPTASGSNTRQPSMTDQGLSQSSSGAQGSSLPQSARRLQSIPEHYDPKSGSPNKRVRVQPQANFAQTFGGSDITTAQAESPRAPPGSAARRDEHHSSLNAGHTPMSDRSRIGSSFEDPQSTQTVDHLHVSASELAPPQGNNGTRGRSTTLETRPLPGDAATDHNENGATINPQRMVRRPLDPELQSPKYLPERPSLEGEGGMVDQLTSRLTEVALDPEARLPVVVRRQQAEERDENEFAEREVREARAEDTAEMPSPLSPGPGHGQGSQRGENDGTAESNGRQDGGGGNREGVRLRSQRSLNFGAQLGSLR